MSDYPDDLDPVYSYDAGASLADSGRVAGADHDFPPCCTGCTRPVDPCALEGLDVEQLATVADGLRAACLQRCPGWPERRREPI